MGHPIYAQSQGPKLKFVQKQINQWEISGKSSDTHSKVCHSTKESHIPYITSNFFLVALGGLTWKIFLSEREWEGENVYMQENLMGMGNG